MDSNSEDNGKCYGLGSHNTILCIISYSKPNRSFTSSQFLISSVGKLMVDCIIWPSPWIFNNSVFVREANFFFFFFFFKWKYLLKERNYTGPTKIGTWIESLSTAAEKLGGLNSKTKVPQNLFWRDHLARKWATPLATLGAQLQDQRGWLFEIKRKVCNLLRIRQWFKTLTLFSSSIQTLELD